MQIYIYNFIFTFHSLSILRVFLKEPKTKLCVCINKRTNEKLALQLDQVALASPAHLIVEHFHVQVQSTVKLYKY